MLRHLIQFILGPLLVLVTIPANQIISNRKEIPSINKDTVSIKEYNLNNKNEIITSQEAIQENKKQTLIRYLDSQIDDYDLEGLTETSFRYLDDYDLGYLDDLDSGSSDEEDLESKPEDSKSKYSNQLGYLASPDESYLSDESDLDDAKEAEKEEQDDYLEDVVLITYPESESKLQYPIESLDKDSPFGLNGPVLSEPSSEWSDYLDILKDLGVVCVRKGGSNALITVQLFKPYNWVIIDQQIKTLQKNNIQPFPFFKIHTLPDLNLYEDFVFAAVERYDGDGIGDMSGLLKPIKYWMTTPEPDHPSKQYWKDNPEDYAQLVSSTVKAAKKADPDCKVILAGSYGDINSYQPGRERFFDLVFEELRRLNNPAIDVIDFHIFGLKGDYKNIKDFIALIDELCRTYGYGELPIWITETSTFSGEVEVDDEIILQTEVEQAEELFKRYVYALAQGVEKIFWDGPLSNTEDDNYFGQVGLMDINKTPRLSYFTYKLLVEKLSNVNFKETEILKDGEDGLYLFKFIKDGLPIYVAWYEPQKQGMLTRATHLLEISPIISPYADVTQSIPLADKAGELNKNAYPRFFRTETLSVEDEYKLTLNLGATPVYIEEQKDPPSEVGKGIFQLLQPKERGNNLSVNIDVDWIEGSRTLFSWTQLQPQEDQFNLQELDDFINTWSGMGKKVIMGIMTSSEGAESDDGIITFIPQWVYDADEDDEYPIYIEEEEDKGGRQHRYPVYWNSTYLEKYEDFVRDLALKYDGDERIEYIEIGVARFGGTQIGNKKLLEKYEQEAGFNYELWTGTIKKLIDIYTTHFKKSKLAVRLAPFRFPPAGDDRDALFEIGEYAANHNIYLLANTLDTDAYKFINNRPFPEIFNLNHHKTKTGLWSDFLLFDDKNKTQEEIEQEQVNFTQAIINAIGDIEVETPEHCQDTCSVYIPKTYISYFYLHQKEIEDIESRNYLHLNTAIEKIELELRRGYTLVTEKVSFNADIRKSSAILLGGSANLFGGNAYGRRLSRR